MSRSESTSIKSWIRKMGLRLTRSHQVNRRKTRIRYYTLGNFGVYEQLEKAAVPEASLTDYTFFSWTPYGDQITVSSVEELSQAYDEFVKLNPPYALN